MPAPLVVQFDIHARDAAAQRRFYTGLFGWSADPKDEPSSYTWLFDPDGQSFGGIGQANDGDSPGISFFVQVDDVAATMTEAERLGGGTYWGPREFPDGMVVGCLRDPDGSGILLIRPGREGQPYASRPPVAADRWSWEIQTPDVARATALYGSLFGWTIDAANEWGWAKVNTGPEGGPDGAIAHAETPCVFFYAAVDDATVAHHKAMSLGARTLVDPWQIAGGGTIAVVADPEGNRLGFMNG